MTTNASDTIARVPAGVATGGRFASSELAEPGASAWQRFTQITLPPVRPALMVAILFPTLDVLRIYDLPAIMTAGANNTR